MRISDWSSDVCSSDLDAEVHAAPAHRRVHVRRVAAEERAAGLVGRRLPHRNVEAVAAQPAGDAVAAGTACQGPGRVGAGAEAARADGHDEADIAVVAPEEMRATRPETGSASGQESGGQNR